MTNSLDIVAYFLYFMPFKLKFKFITMNWKSLLTSILTIIIALVVWEMFIKKMVIDNVYEGYYDNLDESNTFDYDSYNHYDSCNGYSNTAHNVTKKVA